MRNATPDTMVAARPWTPVHVVEALDVPVSSPGWPT